jgi:hypothetical protein
MKIWRAFSAEHSALVKIIGRFETLDDAKKAALLFNRLVKIGNSFSPGDQASLMAAVSAACREDGLDNFSQLDAEQLRFFRAIMVGGREVRVEADSADVQALLKVMTHYGAKIEIFSRPPSCVSPP